MRRGLSHLAMEMSGREYSIDEVMREIEKETVFMDRSEGGVTFCGGEPLSHPSDLVALLDRCGALGIHRAVDTTLFASPDTVRSVMERTDLFLVDLKHMDSGSHCRFTGVPNERILSNLRMIAEAGIDFLIRIPLIEGVNADEENISRSAIFLASLRGSGKSLISSRTTTSEKVSTISEEPSTIRAPSAIHPFRSSPAKVYRSIRLLRDNCVDRRIIRIGVGTARPHFTILPILRRRYPDVLLEVFTEEGLVGEV